MNELKYIDENINYFRKIILGEFNNSPAGKYFSNVVNFVPDGYYLSKNLFTKEEALIEFQETLGKEIKIDEISEQYVRFQPTPEELRGELDTKMAWIVCNKTDRNAQPCWRYL